MSSLPETSINGENPPSHSEIDDLDEYCLALLTQLTSPVLTWKVKVILELQVCSGQWSVLLTLANLRTAIPAGYGFWAQSSVKSLHRPAFGYN